MSTADVAFYMPWIGPLFSNGTAVSHGGSETQVYLVACELARRGIRVSLVTFPVDPPPAAARLDSPLLVIRPPSRGDRRFIGKMLESMTVWRLVRDVDARVWVQRPAGTDTALVAFSARLRRRRFVYSSASLVDFDLPRLHANRRDRALFRAGIALASRIVVQTSEQVDLCRARFGREPTLIRSAVEPAPLRTSAPDAFMWIGGLAPYKRPLDFLELAREVPEARFRMVVGSPGGPVRAELDARAAALPNLEILGHRPRQELLELMDAAVAIVSTSEFEGMPNVFLEGWARGIPALALNHDPDGVIEREGLGAFAGGSFAGFADQAREIWRERNAQSELSARCRRYVLKEHSLAAVGDAWIEALGLNPA